MEHIRLEVEVDIRNRRLLGRAFLTLRAITSGQPELHFDAVHFKALSVRLNGVVHPYRYDGRKLTLTPKKPLKADDKLFVEIRYVVTNPPLGLYFIHPDKHDSKKPVSSVDARRR